MYYKKCPKCVYEIPLTSSEGKRICPECGEKLSIIMKPVEHAKGISIGSFLRSAIMPFAFYTFFIFSVLTIYSGYDVLLLKIYGDVVEAEVIEIDVIPAKECKRVGRLLCRLGLTEKTKDVYKYRYRLDVAGKQLFITSPRSVKYNQTAPIVYIESDPNKSVFVGSYESREFLEIFLLISVISGTVYLLIKKVL